jgi:toxin-antitoxin system PIN domain toxin
VTTYLLDVNVLIALVDVAHVQHDSAHEWFARDGKASWATCPMTENAFLRILGNPRYPNTPGSPAAVAPLLTGLRRSAGHVFWPDDIGIVDSDRVDPAKLSTHGQVTDSYLLALAVAHRGKLATFDRRLATNAVTGGARALVAI